MATDRTASQSRAITIRVAVVALVVVVVVGVWFALRYAASKAERELGAALFHGTTPLVARLPAHAETLPAAATRCSNCHEARSSGTVRSGLGAPVAGSTYAMALGSDWLARPQSRRGGPPSVYDAAALCTLLRTGIDPAQVMIPTVMPRYDVTDAQCGALWADRVRQR